jgi:hypothetical protein
MEIFKNADVMIEGIDAWIFSLLAFLGAFSSFFGARMLRTDISTHTARLKITGNNGKSVELLALVDSGNLACEPISGKAVIFASVEELCDVLDAPAYEAISEKTPMEEMSFSVASKIRLVAGGSIVGRELLPAVRLENVLIKYGKREKPLDVYFAFVDREKLGKYGAIVPSEAII